MKIKKLHFSNYKSIKDLAIENPNPFSVFIGPNGAGKSNIFEALEFFAYELKRASLELINSFGGAKNIYPFNNQDDILATNFRIQTYGGMDSKCEINYIIQKTDLVVKNISINGTYDDNRGRYYKLVSDNILYRADSIIYPFNHSRIFLGNKDLLRIIIQDDSKISIDGSNLEKVLSRILQDKNKRDEIIEWLQVLIPEFKDIQIDTSSLSGDVSYVIYEKHTNKPFPKHLISDGTKNILALLTVVYQSDEPQFLCIEEPENGLHPYAIENLVSIFRNACKDRGHFIWLNTHSQTLVRQLTTDEIIVVEKKNGETKVRQFADKNLHGLKMDEAWLTNTLGGGLP